MASSAAAAAGGTAAGGAAGAGAAGLTAGGVLASAGQFIGGMFGGGAGIAAGTMGPPTAAAAAGANLGALLFNPVTAALAAIALGFGLDSGGTPTSTAGITMAKTGGMSDDNIFQTSPFESGFAPLGFKQNATNAQAEAAIKPLRDLDAMLTALAESMGYSVNLSGHTFNGLGVEGSGPGTVLGTFIEEGKTKGKPMTAQLDTFAEEWVRAVGARNNLSANEISQIFGSGGAKDILDVAGTSLLEHRSRILMNNANATLNSSSENETVSSGTERNAELESFIGRARDAYDSGVYTQTDVSNVNPFSIIDGSVSASDIEQRDDFISRAQADYQAKYVDGQHRDGLDMVPYDGYVAELHAGERVQTAEQARASDNIADEMSGLRQSIEDVMIAVARNTQKLYRLNDRWDKNGLPPVRA